VKAHRQSIFIVLAFCRVFSVPHSIFLVFFFSLIILSNVNLIITNKNSHLLEPASVLVIDEVILEFRVDICETIFPHECRRSGLNDGTIRKWRVDVTDESRLIFSPPDMMIMIDCSFLFLFLQTSTITKPFGIIIKHVQLYAHCCIFFCMSCEYKMNRRV
jgi:hypothetical protein